MPQRALSRCWPMKSLCACALLVISVQPSLAAAQPSWGVLPIASRGVAPTAAATFRDLLESELQGQLQGRFTRPPINIGTCTDPACAREVGADLALNHVVYGSVSALGSKVVVHVTVMEVASGVITTSQRLKVGQVEELDVAAQRIAAAIAQGTPASATAELGSVTSEEARPDLRRHMDRGATLRVGALVPFGDGYAESVGGGLLFDLAYWFEARSFAFEPRIGIRFDAVTGEQSYGEIPLDVGAFYIFGWEDVALFAGGGIGARYMWETRGEVVKVGKVIFTETDHLSDDAGWGFGAYGRLGLLLARTYTARFAVIADYNITVISLNGADNPTAVTLAAGVIF